MGETPVRSIRMPDGRWQAVKDLAKEEKKTASEVVNEAVEGHLKKKGKKR